MACGSSCCAPSVLTNACAGALPEPFRGSSAHTTWFAARRFINLPMYTGFARQRYEVTSLPFIPFSGTGGEALSNTGAVVGGMPNPDGSVSLVQWRNGELTD